MNPDIVVALVFGAALGGLWMRLRYLSSKLQSLDRTVRLMKVLNQRSPHHHH